MVLAKTKRKAMKVLVILVNIIQTFAGLNERGREQNGDIASILEHSTQGQWRISLKKGSRAYEAKYVFGVSNGKVKSVYAIKGFSPVGKRQSKRVHINVHSPPRSLKKAAEKFKVKMGFQTVRYGFLKKSKQGQWKGITL